KSDKPVTGDDRHVAAMMLTHFVEHIRYLFGAFSDDEICRHDVSYRSFPDVFLGNNDALDDVALGKNAGQTVLVKNWQSVDIFFGHVQSCLEHSLIDDGCKKRSSLNEIAHSAHAVFPIGCRLLSASDYWSDEERIAISR